MKHPNKSKSPDAAGLTQNEKTNKTQLDSMLENLSMVDDWALITLVFSVQFSLKKVLFYCEWQPYLSTQKQLAKLAGSQAYFDAWHRFVSRLISQQGWTILMLCGGAK